MDVDAFVTRCLSRHHHLLRQAEVAGSEGVELDDSSQASGIESDCEFTARLESPVQHSNSPFEKAEDL